MARRRNGSEIVMNAQTSRLGSIMGIIIILISLTIWGVSVYNFNYAKKAVTEGVSISATCTKTWSETKTRTHKSKYGSSRKTKTTSYYANASYMYGGQNYHCNKLSVSSSTKVGSSIGIYILPENPAKYVQSADMGSLLITSLICGVMTLMGTSGVTAALRYRKNSANRQNYLSSNIQPVNPVPQTMYNNSYNPNNTYRGYDGRYNPNNTYQGYNNPW